MTSKRAGSTARADPRSTDQPTRFTGWLDAEIVREAVGESAVRESRRCTIAAFDVGANQGSPRLLAIGVEVENRFGVARR